MRSKLRRKGKTKKIEMMKKYSGLKDSNSWKITKLTQTIDFSKFCTLSKYCVIKEPEMSCI